MAKISICIEMIFSDSDLYDRPAKVADAGFGAVEFWGYADKDLPKMKAACDKAGVAVAGILGPAGVSFVELEPKDKVTAAMKDACEAAAQLDAPAMIVTVGNELDGVSREEQADRIVANLKACAPVAEDAGLKLAVEPLNTLVDHMGYFLDRTADGAAICERVGSPAVGLLYDVYHMQIMEGNLIATIREHADLLHHVHIADVPGRFEPGTGEINYAAVLAALDEAGYDGWCGFEFRPSDSPEAALARAKTACGLK